MPAPTLRGLIVTALIMTGSPTLASAQSNPCDLLTSAEAIKHDSWMGEICRKDASKMKPKEQEDCKKVLADTSETQESLQPAVTEMAKLLVAKVRSGKGL